MILALLGAAWAQGLVAGESHTCAVDQGRVLCWGVVSGQAYERDSWEPRPPVDIPSLGGATSISLGESHLCAVIQGELRCQGYDSEGQLGRGEDEDQDPAHTVGPVRQVVAGQWHTCALDDEGQVWCWGSNESGQLALAGGKRRTPEVVPGLDPVRQLVGTHSSMCALTEGGEVWCWGANRGGQLARDDTSWASEPSRVGVRKVRSLVAGGEAICALHQGGGLSCWGATWSPGDDYVRGLRRMKGYEQARVAAVGDGGLCAAVGRGQVRCDGWFMDPHPEDRPVLDLGGEVRELAVGRQHACARRADGAVLCWGEGEEGQLGLDLGGGGQPLPPVAVLGLEDAVSLAAGEDHTCALRADGTAACWGEGGYGVLGNGDESERAAPDAVLDLARAEALGVSNSVGCARLRGEVRCWGHASGGLGFQEEGWGKVSSRARPVQSLPGSGALCTSGAMACAVVQDRAWCWGRDYAGETGQQVPENTQVAPTAVGGPQGVEDLACGGGHTCALTQSGEVWCWGRAEHGHLGTGDPTSAGRPARVSLGAAVDLSASDRRTCAVQEDGALRCWGGDAWTPLVFPDSLRVKAVDVHGDRVCVVRDQGTVACLGPIQAGISSAIQWHDVPDLADVSEVEVGREHACALHTDGRVSCWGDPSGGRLGDGAGTWRAAPVPVDLSKR